LRLRHTLQQTRIALFDYQPDWGTDSGGLRGKLHWSGARFGIDDIDGGGGLANLLLAVAERDRHTLLCVLGLARPHRDGGGEFRATASDGAPLDLFCHAQVQADTDGRVEAVSGVVRDVTERRRMLGGLAHEIGNLLQPVVMLSEDMLDRKLAVGEGVGHLNIVLDCCLKAKVILGSLLAYSRRVRTRATTANARVLLDECLGLVGKALPQGVTMVVRAGDWPHDLDISVDRTGFTQVVLNLAHNAAAAMNGGGEVVIALDRVSGPDATPCVALRVIDSGCGMDQATAKRAFEPFFTTKPVGQGTGLGLPLVQALVTEMRGTVTLESTQGAGTTVTVLIPIHQGVRHDGGDSAD
jgi:signal transduction histidine kinase